MPVGRGRKGPMGLGHQTRTRKRKSTVEWKEGYWDSGEVEDGEVRLHSEDGLY